MLYPLSYEGGRGDRSRSAGALGRRGTLAVAPASEVCGSR